MTAQLTIFHTGITCDHCGEDPGRKSEVVWQGFLDKDTGHKVCWKCYHKHYYEKWKGEHRGKFSEFPVIVKPH